MEKTKVHIFILNREGAKRNIKFLIFPNDIAGDMKCQYSASNKVMRAMLELTSFLLPSSKGQKMPPLPTSW